MPPSTSSSSSSHPATAAESAAALLQRLEAAWRRTDAIFELVRPESLGERPIALRNPLVFYVGHMPAFAWNLMLRGVLGREDSPRPEFDRLFDFGIDPDDEDHRPETPEWPPVDEILRYRDAVRARVREGAGQLEALAAQNVLAANARILHLVLEHEVMHHETLLYMLQELAPEHKRRAAWWQDPVRGSDPGPRGSVTVPAGEVTLGADFDAIPFGWDNEFPARRARVEAFELDLLPVTIGDWLGFVESGGYRDRSRWDERSWSWVEKSGLVRPKDWLERGGRLLVRTMFDEVPLDEVAAWPVCVSWAEADAYARWKGRRLPSEAELVRAAHGDGEGRDERRSAAQHGNVDFRHHSPTPIGLLPAGGSPFGVRELVGSGWEWTATPFERHEGFRAYMQGYQGYSADFFDGAHYVIFGGSWATDARLLRPSFRNWFRFNYPFPFTKFRLARSL